MTWKEFKEEVEKQLEEQDISEDEDIFYIDFGGYDTEEAEVSLDDTGIAIY